MYKGARVFVMKDPDYDSHLLNSEREKLDSLDREELVKLVDELLVTENICMVLILGRK